MNIKTNSNPLKTLKMIIFSVSILISMGQLSAQTTVNSAGGTATIAGNVYEYNIGEMAAVTTFTNANIVITQGLLQPTVNSVGVNEPNIKPKMQFSVFPNPTQNTVNLQLTNGESGTLTYSLYNSLGQKICEQSSAISASDITTIPINHLCSGHYFLYVQFNNSIINSEAQSFKIQIIN